MTKGVDVDSAPSFGVPVDASSMECDPEAWPLARSLFGVKSIGDRQW